MTVTKCQEVMFLNYFQINKINMRILKKILKVLPNKKYVKFYSSDTKKANDVNRIRNIGILAHIDAGKTTTTERMLFYSGMIRSMGEVHHGNTVTDYMEQERERGITITSASVSFQWKDHTFNLIDTPGHIDFTMEVEQTLNVLDGAVIVLDASAGVEAQTLTVWKQADRYNVPRIVYINKVDRNDADIEMCCKSIESKLEKPTILLQIPIKNNGKFVGLIDIIRLKKILWEDTNRGKIMKVTDLSQLEDKEFWDKVIELRCLATDKLSDSDDHLAETIIQTGSLENVSADSLINSLRKITLHQKAVPILCGSSYKNIGVQPLMDSVISYLPSPIERNKQYQCFENNLCGRAFKVIHDKQKGPLVFFRIYSGKFIKNQKIYNIQQNVTEQTNRLLIAYADDFEEVPEVTNGNIAVVTGLKKTVTGDMVTANVTALASAKKYLMKQKKSKSNSIDEGSVDELFGISRTVPEPVFFCSIEPPSISYQSALDNALNELQREDPSLRVNYNSDTGQTVLGGMGELHLDIIKDRIKKNYKIDTELGPLQIAYRESPLCAAKKQHILETKVGNTKHNVNVTLSIEPSYEKTQKDILKLDKSPESASNLANLHPKYLLAVKQGIDAAVNHGPKLGCPVDNISITLHFIEIGRGTSETMISAAVTQCIQKLLSDVGTQIWEPVMHLEIVTDENNLSSVLADLSRRRAAIQNVDVRKNSKIVSSLTPLSELMGYSTDLRTITSGTATFNMEFHSYEKMSALDEANAVKNIVGF